MKQYFRNQNSKNLILFLCGWGMDERPLEPLSCKSDILFLYDYSELSLDFDFSKYENITLIAFSCGVFMTSYLRDILPKCNLKIAINGTLKLFDEKYGLSKEVSETFLNISMENYLEFREKMLVNNKDELKQFNKFSPRRTIESSLEEFSMLKKYSKQQTDANYKFDKILIAENDKILPSSLQKNFWKTGFKVIPGAHFMFYTCDSFEEIIKL